MFETQPCLINLQASLSEKPIVTNALVLVGLVAHSRRSAIELKSQREYGSISIMINTLLRSKH